MKSDTNLIDKIEVSEDIKKRIDEAEVLIINDIPYVKKDKVISMVERYHEEKSKEEHIEFAKWLIHSGFKQASIKDCYSYQQPIAGKQVYFKIEELYNLYIKSR